jgi:hypothetical protein
VDRPEGEKERPEDQEEAQAEADDQGPEPSLGGDFLQPGPVQGEMEDDEGQGSERKIEVERAPFMSVKAEQFEPAMGASPGQAVFHDEATASGGAEGEIKAQVADADQPGPGEEEFHNLFNPPGGRGLWARRR